MLDKNDLKAISELIDDRLTERLAESEKRTAVRIEEAMNQAITYSENVLERKLDVIKEGLDLALEGRIPPERIERIEGDVAVLKAAVSKHSEEIENLKKAQ